MRADVKEINVSRELVSYAVMITEATRSDTETACGASPRALLSMLRCAQSYALFGARDYCIPEDILSAAMLTLPHRLILTPQARMNHVSQEQILKNITNHIKVPS